jgi:hypothetical protein
MPKAAPSKVPPVDAVQEARRCIRGAEEFLLTSHRAFDQPLTADGKRFEPAASIPGVVCAAFAAELGFKAILLLERGERWMGHKLAELFPELSEDARRGVEQSAKGKSKHKSYLGADGHRTSLFSEGLDAVSSTFEDWRCFYEKGDQIVDPTFLQKVATGAIEKANSLLPPL